MERTAHQHSQRVVGRQDPCALYKLEEQAVQAPTEVEAVALHQGPITV